MDKLQLRPCDLLGWAYCNGCCNSCQATATTHTPYDPIEIARRYAPKFDKPVVDMVEVVRCKDCKHQERIAGYSDYQPNTVFCNKWEHLTDIQGHCYKGERKDEVEK